MEKLLRSFIWFTVLLILVMVVVSSLLYFFPMKQLVMEMQMVEFEHTVQEKSDVYNAHFSRQQPLIQGFAKKDALTALFKSYLDGAVSMESFQKTMIEAFEEAHMASRILLGIGRYDSEGKLQFVSGNRSALPANLIHTDPFHIARIDDQLFVTLTSPIRYEDTLLGYDVAVYNHSSAIPHLIVGEMVFLFEKEPSALKPEIREGTLFYSSEMPLLGYYMTGQVPAEHMLSLFYKIMRNTLLLLVSVTAIILWIGWWFLLRQSRKVVSQYQQANRNLAETTQELQASQTELIRAKEEAEAATASKSKFLSTMSHELRTPLNGIIGFSEFLAQTALDEEQKDCVQTIRYSSEILRHVIGNILDFSKIEAGRMQLNPAPTNMKDLCHRVIKIMELQAQENGSTLELCYDESIPKTLVLDGMRVQQVLLNLIGNAAKFTKNGKITLLVQQVKQDDEEKTALIHFEVKDTGIGIPEEAIQKIFKSFEQADKTISSQYGGTGLGLSISAGILSLMGSSLHLESKLGEGSTFSFDIKA